MPCTTCTTCYTPSNSNSARTHPTLSNSAHGGTAAASSSSTGMPLIPPAMKHGPVHKYLKKRLSKRCAANKAVKRPVAVVPVQQLNGNRESIYKSIPTLQVATDLNLKLDELNSFKDSLSFQLAEVRAKLAKGKQ
eukprot:sb/3474706/